MMKKKESTLFNMVLILLLITLAAGLSLGYVNEITQAPKAQARLAKKVSALKTVLPAFDNDPVAEGTRIGPITATDSMDLYPAYQQGARVGTAVSGSSDRGYSGTVQLLVGFETDGRIRNIAVLEQKETPGLGTKMKSDRFLEQFKGIDPGTYDLRVTKDGGEVDALAGATISTRAFCEAVLEAHAAFAEHAGSGDGPPLGDNHQTQEP